MSAGWDTVGRLGTMKLSFCWRLALTADCGDDSSRRSDAKCCAFAGTVWLKSVKANAHTMIAAGVFFLIGPSFCRSGARTDESARAPYSVEKPSLTLLRLPQRGVLK